MHPAFLRLQALRLRRLAGELNDESGRAVLLDMADECEARAAEEEADKPSAEPGC
jgi:hypothetical protein